MRSLKMNDRVIVDIEIEMDGVDSFIMSAIWDDTGELLSVAELNDLQEANEQYVYEMAMGHYGYGID